MSFSQSVNASEQMTATTSSQIQLNGMVGHTPATVFQQNQGDLFLRFKLDDASIVFCPVVSQPMCLSDGSSILQSQHQPGSGGISCVSGVMQPCLGVVVEQKPNDTSVIKQHDCGYCHQMLASDQELRQHIDIIHAGMRRFPCNICGKAYSKSFLLKNHIKSWHEQIRDVPCQICQKAFCKRSVMKRHMKSVHTDAKNFPCQMCAKAFAEKKNLQMHIDAHHKGLKPFRCSTCGKDFARKCDLIRHVNSVHKETKPFQCNFCGKGFPQRWYLDRHVLAVHKVTLQQIPPVSSVFGNHQLVQLSSQDHEDTNLQQQQPRSQSQPQEMQTQPQQQYPMQQHQQQQLIHQQHQIIQQTQQLTQTALCQQQQQQMLQHVSLVRHQQHQHVLSQHQQVANHLQFATIPQSMDTPINIVPNGARFATVSFPTSSGVATNALMPTMFFQPGVMPSGISAEPQMQFQSPPTIHMHHLPSTQVASSAVIAASPSVIQSSSVSIADPTKQRHFRCDICGKMFQRNQSLQAHRIQVHSDVKPYTCRLCPKGFVRRWDFYRHVNALHKNRAQEALEEAKRDEYRSWMRNRNASTVFLDRSDSNSVQCSQSPNTSISMIKSASE